MAYAPTRFFGGAITAAANAVIATIATGKTAIIKQIVVTNTSSAPTTISLAIGPAYVAGSLAVGANATVILDLTQVANASETLTASSPAAAAIHVIVSGVVFP